MKKLDDKTAAEIRRYGVSAVDYFEDAKELADKKKMEDAMLCMDVCLLGISELSGIEIDKVKKAFEGRKKDEHVFAWTTELLKKEGFV